MEPYLDDSGYTNRYVAFLDILGFSDLTVKADNHPSWRAYLRQSILALNSMMPHHIEQTGFRFAQFSDAIVMSAQRTPQGMTGIIFGCNLLTRSMLSRGILLRGGIAAGNFHHDDHMMFGPALVRAHSHDKRGSPPHIALEHDVIEDMKPSLIGPSFTESVASDPWDLSPMLHTLREFADYDAVPRPGFEALDEPAVYLAHQIQSNASNMSFEPAVRAKWRWMQDYWNRSVAPKGILTLSQHNQDWDAVMNLVRHKASQRSIEYSLSQGQARATL